jgi:hypothetical protein
VALLTHRSISRPLDEAVDLLLAYLLEMASNDIGTPHDDVCDVSECQSEEDASPVEAFPPGAGLSSASRSARRSLRPPPEASS